MKSLKESLLSKTNDKVAKGKELVNKLALFGNTFKLSYVRGLTNKSAQCISVKGMKNLTKGMDYIDPLVEKGVFDSRNKVKMLCNFIEHINLAEWGYIDIDWVKDRERRLEFFTKVNEYIHLNGGFNGKFTRLWCNGYSFDGGEPLKIMVSNMDINGGCIVLEFDFI